MIEFSGTVRFSMVKSINMESGQTGIIIGDKFGGEPVMKTYDGVLISLIDADKAWSGNPDFDVRLCDFELREI